MKAVRFLAVLALMTAVLAPAASAADFGVRVGRFNDAEEEFVGAEMAWNAGSFTLNPNIEYILTDDDLGDVTQLTGNFDVAYNFGRGNTFTPWLGAGIGVLYTSAEVLGEDINETDPVINLIGGVSWNLDFLKPYAQLKYMRGLDEDEVGDDIALAIGLRF